MKTASLIIAVFVALLVGCQSVPPPAAGMATLRLTVIAEPKTGVITGNTHVLSYDAPSASSNGSGEFEKVDYAGLDDIVVWLEGSEAPTTNPAKVNVIPIDVNPAQPAEGLSAVAGVGELLFISNRGSKTINIYSVSDGNEFDLGPVPAGGSAGYPVKSPGLIEILADSAKDPLAKVYAAPTPWVRLTHAGEAVEFRDLPPGQYKIVSWHPRLPGREITATLPPNQITEASIKVGVNDLPKIVAP